MADPIVQSATLQGLNLVIRITKVALDVAMAVKNARETNKASEAPAASETREEAGVSETQAYNVRNIAITELVHDMNNFDTVRAYVGVKDPTQRPLFAPRVQKQFIGIIKDEAQLKHIRDTFKQIGPVIEY